MTAVTRWFGVSECFSSLMKLRIVACTALERSAKPDLVAMSSKRSRSSGGNDKLILVTVSLDLIRNQLLLICSHILRQYY